MRFSPFVRAVAATAILLLVPTLANAQSYTMFDNFDTGDAYDPNAGAGIHWINDYLSLGLGASDQDYAQAFTASGSGYNILSIELALSRYSGENEVDISLLADAAGLPGAVLQTWHLSGALPVFPSNNAPVAVSTTSLVLTDGVQYWVAVSTPGPLDSEIIWHRNTVGYLGLAAGRHVFNGGGSWLTNNLGDATMRIKGFSRTIDARTDSWGAVKSLFR